MKRLIILICTACWLTVCAQGSESPTYEMYYTVTPDTANHYLNVRLDYERKEAGNAELVLNMPRWAPGYYEILDFAKHLCDFSATDGAYTLNIGHLPPDPEAETNAVNPGDVLTCKPTLIYTKDGKEYTAVITLNLHF